MANVLVQESSLSAIADAIREKNGTQNTYKPAQMADAISAITGGGITPTGTINITTNGTHDVTNYASANVAVPQGTTPTGTKEISITQNGTTTEDVTNYANAEITVNVPSGGGGYTVDNIIDRTPTGAFTVQNTSIRAYALYDFGSITRVTASNCTAVGEKAFQGSITDGIYAADFPLLKTLSSSGFYGFLGTFACLVSQQFNLNTTLYLSSCPNLQVADLHGSSSAPSVLGKLDRTFQNSSSLNTVILRNSFVVALSNVNAFNGTPFASGGAGGTLYVPQSLLSSYESATNWSTLLGYENNQIKAIEGSIYETKYADGTSISS